jgi:hypothetical protein
MYVDSYDIPEYQSGPGHSRASVAIEDALSAAGIPLEVIRHNKTQVRTQDPARSAKRVVRPIVRQGEPPRRRVVRPGKPDISYWDPLARQRVNVEIDTVPRVSRDHQRQLRAFDPRARNIFLVIDPRTGAIRETRISDPRVRPGRIVRSSSPPTLSDLVRGQANIPVFTQARIPLAVLTQAAGPRAARGVPARGVPARGGRLRVHPRTRPQRVVPGARPLRRP